MKGAQSQGHGRPLRFLGAVTTGWIGLRTVLLWPGVGTPVPLAETHLPPFHPIAAFLSRVPLEQTPRSVIGVSGAEGGSARTTWPPASPASAHGTSVAMFGAAALPDMPIDRHPAAIPRPVLPTIPPFVVTVGAAASGAVRARRWSGSGWVVGRAGVGTGNGLPGGQLGGSQAGIRILRTLDRRGRVALAGRLTTPLGQGLREASLGLEWQPTRLPIRIVAEQRFVLGSGHGGPGIGVIGGFGPLPIAHGIQAEGYGQAGVIRRADTEPYADAALRLTRTTARLAQARVDLGIGLWGGAQRGAARLDVGPTLAVALPVAKTSVRLTLDWRERIAGDAHPNSGPALTLGTDF